MPRLALGVTALNGQYDDNDDETTKTDLRVHRPRVACFAYFTTSAPPPKLAARARVVSLAPDVDDRVLHEVGAVRPLMWARDPDLPAQRVLLAVDLLAPMAPHHPTVPVVPARLGVVDRASRRVIAAAQLH
jgi:hypothetical protein